MQPAPPPLPKKSAPVSHRALKVCTTLWQYLLMKCNASLGLNLPLSIVLLPEKGQNPDFSDFINKL